MKSLGRWSSLRSTVCVVLLLALALAVPGSARAAPLAVVSFTVTPVHIDDGQSSVFNVTVSAGTPPYQYNWSGLPPSLSWAPCMPANASKLTCAVGVPGTYMVGVNVTDAAGHRVAAGPLELTVAQPIGANADVAPHEGPVPLSVTFTNYGTGGTPPYSFQWLFGDGSQADVANTSHIYAAGGRYIVYGCMGDSLQAPMCEIFSVTAFAPLAVSLVAGPSPVTVGNTTYLNATVSGGLANWTYTWSSLPPGCISQNVSSLRCVPSIEGTYEVQATVRDGLGNVVSATAILQVVASASPRGASSGLTPLEWVLAGAVVALGIGIVALAVVVFRMRRMPRQPPPS